ncbi:ensconsin-like isoform X2 [Sycon ciliatum]|uniref:ensconsin-like isoform X2 n=1 Tax=Sycon ciliatum TaxID=27933 RepID=UPI0031F6D016
MHRDRPMKRPAPKATPIKRKPVSLAIKSRTDRLIEEEALQRSTTKRRKAAHGPSNVKAKTNATTGQPGRQRAPGQQPPPVAKSHPQGDARQQPQVQEYTAVYESPYSRMVEVTPPAGSEGTSAGYPYSKMVSLTTRQSEELPADQKKDIPSRPEPAEAMRNPGLVERRTQSPVGDRHTVLHGVGPGLAELINPAAAQEEPKDSVYWPYGRPGCGAAPARDSAAGGGVSYRRRTLPDSLNTDAGTAGVAESTRSRHSDIGGVRRPLSPRRNNEGARESLILPPLQPDSSAITATGRRGQPQALRKDQEPYRIELRQQAEERARKKREEQERRERLDREEDERVQREVEEMQREFDRRENKNKPTPVLSSKQRTLAEIESLKVQTGINAEYQKIPRTPVDRNRRHAGSIEHNADGVAAAAAATSRHATTTLTGGSDRDQEPRARILPELRRPPQLEHSRSRIPVLINYPADPLGLRIPYNPVLDRIDRKHNGIPDAAGAWTLNVARSYPDVQSNRFEVGGPAERRRSPGRARIPSVELPASVQYLDVPLVDQESYRAAIARKEAHRQEQRQQETQEQEQRQLAREKQQMLRQRQQQQQQLAEELQNQHLGTLQQPQQPQQQQADHHVEVIPPLLPCQQQQLTEPAMQDRQGVLDALRDLKELLRMKGVQMERRMVRDLKSAERFHKRDLMDSFKPRFDPNLK